MAANTQRRVPKTPAPQLVTQWHNPTKSRVIVDFWVGHEQSNDETGRARYVWEPGETVTLPETLGKGVHTIVNGVVVGGLAPQLVRVDIDEPTPVHPALDVDLQSRKDALEAVQKTADVQRAISEQFLKSMSRFVDADPKPSQPPPPAPMASAAPSQASAPKAQESPSQEPRKR